MINPRLGLRKSFYCKKFKHKEVIDRFTNNNETHLKIRKKRGISWVNCSTCEFNNLPEDKCTIHEKENGLLQDRK